MSWTASGQTYTISTFAGNGTQGFSGDGGSAISAESNGPWGIAIDSGGGSVYFAETGNNRIRKVSNGVITTVAGNGIKGFSGDGGLAPSAELNGPAGVAVDSAGNLYIADTGNGRIRKVSNGMITTVAGDGDPNNTAALGLYCPSCIGDNGPATEAVLAGPYGLAVDSVGNLYIADPGTDRIRKVSNGLMTTAVGSGTVGFSGDGGPATSAELNAPMSVAVDLGGDVYFADFNNNRIRKVSSGVITTLAGSGPAGPNLGGFSGDGGLATSAKLNFPEGVAVDSAGNLYIADNNRIRKVSNGVITTVAGDGTEGFSGDGGLATSAELNGPTGVAVDSGGSVYFADFNNNRIRLLTPGESQTISFGPISNQILANSPFSLSATASSGLAVMFASNSTAVCTVSGVIVKLVAVGTCSITANQPGNVSFSAATPVTQSFTVSSVIGATPQTITFGPLSNVTFGVGPFTIDATSSSGIAVSFASTTAGVCTVSGSIVTIIAVGVCSITASQAGNSVYAAAIPVTQTFIVSATTTGPQALQLITVAPCRIMDTRNSNGPFGGPFVAAGTSRTIPIPSSTCGIPANASAYSLNFTVVPRAGTLGYLSVWPAGQAQPLVSTLNSPDGSVLANAAIVPAGTSGAIDAYATNDTDLIVDINGYFVPPASNSLQFYPLPPCRVLDTRNPNGTFGGPSIAGGASRSFPIPSSSCGVPANAAAYAFNVTVVPHGALAYLTAWPTGQTQPVVSTLNSFDGTILANAAIVPAGTAGAASFYASNTTDLVVDINGYFAPPGTGGLNFYPVTPCRLVDTRNANGVLGGPTMGAGTTRAYPLSQGSCGLPGVSGAEAYSLNMTVVPQGVLSYLSTWPTGGTQPVVSTLNAWKGQAKSLRTRRSFRRVVPAQSMCT
ncbi:MAG: NHL repeat-containing protein [Bryobacteraceae bacterium]